MGWNPSNKGPEASPEEQDEGCFSGAPILRFQRRSSSGPPKQDSGWAGPGKLLLQFFFYFLLFRFERDSKTALEII
jgi:hypothetical protein